MKKFGGLFLAFTVLFLSACGNTAVTVALMDTVLAQESTEKIVETEKVVDEKTADEKVADEKTADEPKELTIYERYGYYPSSFIPNWDAGVKTLYFFQETNDMLVNAAYPETESETVNKIIQQMIMDDIASFTRANGEKGILEINYKIYRHSEFIMGFAFENREFTEDDGFITSTKTLVFDFLGGIPIPISSMFDGTDYIDVIKTYAEKQLQMIVFADVSVSLPAALSNIGKSGFGRYVFDDKNFYIFLELGHNATLQTCVPLAAFNGKFIVDNYLSNYFAEDETPLEDVPKENVLATDGAKYVAITFDDGPHATYTTWLLNQLAELEVKATFFVLGHRIEATSALLKRMADEGHEIGCHSFNHAQLNAISAQKLYDEVVNTNDLIRQYSGKAPVLLRPPYGETNKRVVDLARDKGQTIILWGVDPRDWATKSASTVCDNILKQTKNGSIILVHDIYDSSVKGAVAAIKNLKEQGYQFVTVSELIELTGTKMLPGQVYADAERLITKWN